MSDAPRFGIWAAVHGAAPPSTIPTSPTMPRWERNRALVLEAEALGFDSVARRPAHGQPATTTPATSSRPGPAARARRR